MAKKKTTDALEILDRMFFNTPEEKLRVQEAYADTEVAQQIYDLRHEAGLTQAELAKLIGTSRSVISRLEDSDYEGHSLGMLYRIAAVLHRKVQIRFVPNGKPKRKKKR
jgi:DNA-binding XRE family transcriptional regulator